MIQLSENAVRKIRSLKEEEGRPVTDLLRVEVKKGGCSGLSYKMEFVSNPQGSDKVVESGNERVAIDSGSLLYLAGMTLDYSGGLNGKGFVFDNPNAAKKCSCGTSFNVAKTDKKSDQNEEPTSCNS